MRQVTASGKTVAEAVETALQQLQVPKDEVSVHVIDEGKRGLFGIFGATRAVVKVTLKQETTNYSESTKEIVTASSSVDATTSSEDQIPSSEEADRRANDEERIKRVEDYIINVAKAMDVPDVKVEAKVSGRDAYIVLSSEKIARLIGKRGQTLNALQALVQVVMNKGNQRFYQVMLDAENYRSKRRETLCSLANRMADRALNIKKKVALEPMPSFERKVIHKTLERRNEIFTKSEGRDPHRHIVIEPVETNK